MSLFDLFRKKPKTVLDALNENLIFKQQKLIYDSMCLMCEDGVDADELPNGIGDFGMSPNNPIPCKTVFGSTSYLGRLRDLDGIKLVYDRIGSFSSDVTSQPVDGYKISHPEGMEFGTIYISPYQKRTSAKAPMGFKLESLLFG